MESKFWPKEFGFVVLIQVQVISDELSVGESMESTTTSYLAANAVLEDALVLWGGGKNNAR